MITVDLGTLVSRADCVINDADEQGERNVPDVGSVSGCALAVDQTE